MTSRKPDFVGAGECLLIRVLAGHPSMRDDARTEVIQAQPDGFDVTIEAD